MADVLLPDIGGDIDRLSTSSRFIPARAAANPRMIKKTLGKLGYIFLTHSRGNNVVSG